MNKFLPMCAPSGLALVGFWFRPYGAPQGPLGPFLFAQFVLCGLPYFPTGMAMVPHLKCKLTMHLGSFQAGAARGGALESTLQVGPASIIGTLSSCRWSGLVLLPKHFGSKWFSCLVRTANLLFYISYSCRDVLWRGFHTSTGNPKESSLFRALLMPLVDDTKMQPMPVSLGRASGKYSFMFNVMAIGHQRVLLGPCRSA